MPISLDVAGQPIDQDLPEHISFDFQFGNPLDNHTQEGLHKIAVGWGLEAQQKFDESIRKLLSSVRNCGPIPLLSHFAYYDFMFYEKYTENSEYSPVEQHNVEILQALILSVPQADLSFEQPTDDQCLEINQLLKDSGTGFALKRLAQEGGLETIIREQARSHTQAVRNPGSEGQIWRNLRELFAPLDSQLQQRKGVTFSGLIALCEGFKVEILTRFNDHRKIIHASYQEQEPLHMIEIYGKGFGMGAAEIHYLKSEATRQSSTREQTKIALFRYSEKYFPTIFSAQFDILLGLYPGIVDPAALKKAISLWSLKFGDLQTSNFEHLFLNNPIWSKPFLEISDGAYFWPLFSTFIGFGIEMLEAQMEGDQLLKDAYHDRRAQFTEDKSAELLADLGPGARVLRNLQWKDSDTGQDWENDLLVLFDTHAIIVECKSGRIKDAARRGGASLNEALKKLIQEPTEQGFRFEQFLKAQQGTIQLTNDQGLTDTITVSDIRTYTRLNLVLDYLGPLATQDKLLRRADMITTSAPSAVTMALVDLENIFYLIESTGQRLHYLHRRAGLERTFEIIGDELDLLAYYLAGGRWPADNNTKMGLIGCSRKLDGYLRRRDLALSKFVPKLKLNLWWKEILDRVETKPFFGWTDAAIILLSFPLKHQDEYRNLVESTLVEMSISPQLIEGRDILMAAYPTALEMVGLVTYISTRDSRDENRLKVMRALEHLADMVPKPDGGVALLVFPDGSPYNILAMAS